MTDLRKAAQMALDWRDKNSELLFELGGWDFIFEINDWSQSIRGALAQPKEPDWSAAGFGKPSKREWQGLTDEEIQWCYEEGNPLRAIEAKLKEKNNG